MGYKQPCGLMDISSVATEDNVLVRLQTITLSTKAIKESKFIVSKLK